MAIPLLLIPGMMCDARVFFPQITVFSAERDVHIASLAQCETIEEMAQAVLENAPPHFALAGHSMGGIVAMEVVRRAPERVTKVALISTNSQAETPAVAAAREPQIVGVMAGRLTEVMQDVIRPEYLAAGPKRTEIMTLVQEMALSLGEGEFVRQSRALQRRPDQQKTLRKIRMPALVMCGAEDGLTLPRRHEFMSAMIPYSTLQIIDGAGHFPMLEAPEATNTIFREWLDAPLVLR
ncbi:MAG TPA: alpha/beta hydrolase [Rhodobacteraceae bacterium]|nr:alpha/beta hydrolase [Paracoccaceae bacterium]